MNEFTLITNVGNLPTITINDEELKAQLSKELEIYKVTVFTEAQKGEAKKDLATLRKLYKELDDKRKEIKKQYLVPYNDFEARVKSLLAIIDEPIGIIDAKVKEFEEKAKEEKKNLIKQIFAEEMAEYSGNVSLESIYKPQWENATYAESAIRSDMQEVKLGIDKDINVLLAFKNDSVDRAIEKYYKNGRDLAGAIQYLNECEAIKKEALEKQEKEAAAKVAEPIQNEPIGFAVNNEVEIHLAVLVDATKVNDLMKLLKDNGYKAERI